MVSCDLRNSEDPIFEVCDQWLAAKGGIENPASMRGSTCPDEEGKSSGYQGFRGHAIAGVDFEGGTIRRSDVLKNEKEGI